ncbi:MAG: 50S ribosomal protein L33 [Bacilli bacterium]
MMKVTLACSQCGSRNYSLPKNNTTTTRLEVNKFCKVCNAHVLHKETK